LIYIYGRTLVVAEPYDSAIIDRVNDLSHLIELDNALNRNLLFYAKQLVSRGCDISAEIIFANVFSQHLSDNMFF
jgi:hypothetical protein